MEEVWKPVIGYEDYYKVSNLGRVQGYRHAGKILKLHPRGKYLGGGFWVNKIEKPFDIHRIVAIHFVPNPHNLPEVNHEDGNTLNNKSNNLRWVSSKENMKHAIDTGLRNDFGLNSVNSKLKEEQVIEIRRLHKEDKLNYGQIAKIYNMNRDYIGLIITRKRWKHLK